MKTMQTLRKLLTGLLAGALAFGSVVISAADDPDPIALLMSKSTDFAQGRRAADAKDWATAIKWYNAADQRNPNNADIHNSLGFAYRNAGQLEPAFKHYQRALQIDPRHLGAHEYIGEAYLMAKNLAKAEEHLAALKRYCRSICEEREDLAKKISEYRKGGGK